MFQTAQPFLLALLIGLAIGIERERAQAEMPGHKPLGSRTFTLLALLGAAAAHFENDAIAVVLAVFAGAIVLAGYFRTRLSPEGEGVGATTEVAAMVTFALGYLAHHQINLSIMLSVLTLVVLASKSSIHQFARAGLKEREVAAAITVLVIAFVVLPLLPDRPVDPWNLVNPARLWLLFVLITGIGFAGYIAVRLLGPDRGFAAAGLFAGFVSSTAATAALAHKSRESNGGVGPLATGIVLASVASAAAQGLVVGIADPRLLREVMPVLAAPVLVGIAATLVAVGFLRRFRPGAGDRGVFALENPIALRPSAVFALLIALVLVAASGAQRLFGTAGVLLTSALGGAANVHAATLAVATLAAGGSVDPQEAVLGVLIAFVANMLVKLVLVAWIGGGRLLAAVAPPLAAMMLAGLAAYWAVYR